MKPTLRRRSLAAVFVGLLTLLLPLSLTGQPATDSSVPPAVPTVAFDGHPYISVADLAEALSADIRFAALKDKVILLPLGGKQIVFTLASSVYLIDQIQFRVPYPTRTHDGRLYVSHEVLRELRLTGTPSHSSGTFVPRQYEPPSGKDLQDKLSIRKIAIDPGHGGKDPGAVGPNRTREKDITLAIASRLGRKLEQDLGVEVVYTRRNDQFVGLSRRARIAREAGADLFVSLHCNAGRRRAAGGIEVYFLSEAKTAAAAEVAARENAAIAFEEDAPETQTDNTLSGIALQILTAQYLRESQDLAASIRGRMARRFKQMDDRGVKQANFSVMRGTMGNMPSVLIEMGFISNPSEEKLLKTERFQKDMANAIFEGIRTFKQAHERQLLDTDER